MLLSSTILAKITKEGNRMSADFTTLIQIEGEICDVISMLKTLQSYSYDKYQENDKEIYLQAIQLFDEDDATINDLESPLDEMSEEEIVSFANESDGCIHIEASGPFGSFGWLDEIQLFENMASVAPDAHFKGSISGFNNGGDQEAEFELKDGLLYSKYATNVDSDFELFDDEYEDEDEDDSFDDYDECEDEIIDDEDDAEDVNDLLLGTKWDFMHIYDPYQKEIVESYRKD